MKTLNSGLQGQNSLSEESDLQKFLEEFVSDLPPSLARFFLAHVGGQLAALRNPSMRHLTSRAGLSDGYLRKLLRDDRWDKEKVLSQVSSHIQRVHGKRLRGLLLDQPVRNPRKAGSQGKPAALRTRKRSLNAIGLTHLVLAERDWCCLLDSDPWLPPKFMKTVPRPSAPVAESGQPESRWRGALELVNRASRGGIRFDWLLLGMSYGVEIDLLQSLSEGGHRFIAEVPDSLTGWLYHPWAPSAEAAQAIDVFRSRSSDSPGRPPRTIKELTTALPPPEEPAPGALGLDSGWKTSIVSFYAQNRGLPTDFLGLLILRGSASGERRYYLGNGFLGMSLESATQIALSKDLVERACRDFAGSVGLGASRVRDVIAYKRHLALSTLAILYRAERALGPARISASPEGSAAP